jgi:hypothetical protein
VAAVGLSLVVLVTMANLIVFQYGRGVVRAALDEGVRQGSRVQTDATAVCTRRVESVLGDLLSGTMGDGVAFTGCRRSGDTVQAHADVTFSGWLPTVPDWSFEVEATAVKEQRP